MSFVIHSSASALSSGSEIWVIADKTHSAWASQLDLYMNFQISRSSEHETPKTTETIQKIREQFSLENFQFEEKPTSFSKSAPLLISTHQFFPNKAVLYLPYEQKNEWIKTIYKNWLSMGKPTLRVFLPEGLNTNDFQNLWPDPRSPDLSLVQELTSET